ncbi:hypothetical protein LZC95_32340 [Pendulispora brunnea]|uniref:Uncharacterized protein n=1 Tax=Pendulispora brunnea TaxID=2905690 RepID=A0ABZ2K1R8_9BACT
MTEDSPVHSITLMLPINGGHSLDELAARHDWKYVEDVPRGYYVPRQRFWEANNETSINDVADHHCGARFVIVSAPSESAVAEIRALIETAISVRTESDLLQVLARADSPEDLIGAILTLSGYRLCTGSSNASSADPRYVAVAKRLASHPNRHVRRALLMNKGTFPA